MEIGSEEFAPFGRDGQSVSELFNYGQPTASVEDDADSGAVDMIDVFVRLAELISI